MKISGTKLRWLERGLKLLIPGLLFWAIYQQVFKQAGLESLKLQLTVALNSGGWYWLIGGLLLMPLNWGMETVKFRFLMRAIEPMSFGRAYRAVLAGVTLAVFTPNRIGEYGGRMLFASSRNRFHTILITLVGSISQIVAIITACSAGAVLFFHRFMDFPAWYYTGMWFLTGITIVLIWICYLNIGLVNNILARIRWTKRFVRYLRILNFYRLRDLLRVLGYSLLRFSIYSIQYYLILRAFGVETGFYDGILIISMIFLIQTALPTIAIAELGIRGNVAIALFSMADTPAVPVIAATFVLWLINLILPAVTGYIFILQQKIFNGNHPDADAHQGR